ncbi:hypothetical protein STAFG_0090 [Streptomyces afghaniensis 772]|uniref:Uncharacterized protein n=1 Tax=Streptomyces afghaniensis 772 TaxID=1283301 RepID=S4NW92_9ACTN|nr:hypothetical protein STAFG_0090 [Streptomyces afghaniensis 772]
MIVGGFVLAVIAYGLFLPVGMDWSYAAMFPTLFLSGLAFALAYGPLTIAATDGSPGRAGSGRRLLTTPRSSAPPSASRR